MPIRNLLLATALTALLSSCSSNSDMRESLGLTRKAPDEFRVYARPSLTVPPEFSLVAPGSVTDAPTGIPADEQARSAVLGDIPPTAGKTDTAVTSVSSHDLPSSNADAQFLQNAGVRSAKPDVRSAIKQESENGLKVKDSSYLVNLTAEGEPVVDATKEAERLKENKEKNKPLTEGETPTVEPKGKGLMGTLGDLF